MRHPLSTPMFMRVPRAPLAVSGRGAQYSGAGRESRVSRAGSGAGGAGTLLWCQGFGAREVAVGVVCELAVAAAVGPVALSTTARGLDRVRPCEGGEGGSVAYAAGLPARDEQLGGADRADAVLGEKRGRKGANRALELPDASGETADECSLEIGCAQPLTGSDQLLAAQALQVLRQERGERGRLRLVERRRTRLDDTAACEQEQVQALAAGIEASRSAQPLAVQQSPRRGSSRRRPHSSTATGRTGRKPSFTQLCPAGAGGGAGRT